VPGFVQVTNSFNHSHVNTGWTGWTYKIEYLYVDLGTLNAGAPAASVTIVTPGNITTTTTTAGPVTTHSHFTDNILRVGLNYQFH
jgi:outer membrane immunogenic protein